MSTFCETLELRTLFSSGIETVTQDYNAVLADARALKADLTSAATTYKADSKLIATDIKALGRSRTNSVDIAKLNRAVAGATALDSKATARLIAAGSASITRAEHAFLAVFTHPTAPNVARLGKAIASLTTVLSPYEVILGNDTLAGDAKVAAALNALVAANPTDTALSNDVSTAETNSSTALGAIASQVSITNTDIEKLATDVS